MNTLKTAIAILFIATTTVVNAQTNDALLGKWETTYEEDGKKTYITYEFKNVKGKLKCYTTSVKNNEGEENYESLAMEDISIKKGKGNAKYMYNEEGENYVLKAKLHFENANTLHISYSYWGYSNTEKWKRIN